MGQSILTSIKQLLGPGVTETVFDTDIIMAINSALFRLTQIGVGPETGFKISDTTSEWEELLDDRDDLEAAKSYVYLKARLLFDPPQNSFLVEAMKDQIKEFEWCLSVQV